MEMAHITNKAGQVSKDLTHISKYEHGTTYSFVPEMIPLIL